MYQEDRTISQVARSLRVSYTSAWSLTEGRKQGFKNRSEYQEDLAVRKGFKNRSEYLEDLAEDRKKLKPNKDLSCLIKSRLKELGKNQSWLANELGVTRQAVSLYAHGKIIPNYKILNLVFSALEVSKKPKSLDNLVEE